MSEMESRIIQTEQNAQLLDAVSDFCVNARAANGLNEAIRVLYHHLLDDCIWDDLREGRSEAMRGTEVK